jgi:hypothetical protein
VVTGALNNLQGEILANGTTQLSGKGQFTNQQGVVSVQELEWISNSGFSNQKATSMPTAALLKHKALTTPKANGLTKKL